MATETIKDKMTESSTSSVAYEAEKGERVEVEDAQAPLRGKRPSVSFSTAADNVLQMSSADLDDLEAAMLEVEGRMVGCGLISRPLTACHCSRLDDNSHIGENCPLALQIRHHRRQAKKQCPI